jgi:hypothetical protein
VPSGNDGRASVAAEKSGFGGLFVEGADAPALAGGNAAAREHGGIAHDPQAVGDVGEELDPFGDGQHGDDNEEGAAQGAEGEHGALAEVAIPELDEDPYGGEDAGDGRGDGPKEIEDGDCAEDGITAAALDVRLVHRPPGWKKDVRDQSNCTTVGWSLTRPKP